MNYYPSPEDPEKFNGVLLKAMLSGLNDANSYYVNPDEYKKIGELVKKSNINFTKFDENTYILKFDWFTKDLQKEMDFLTKDLENSSNKTLIVDFRDNLGGNFESALWFADLFINEKDVVIEKYNNKEVTQRTTSSTPLSEVQIFVIVSSETSSSAEVVAVVLQEKNRATIIGGRSFGKNSIGNFFELSDKSAIHLTIGKWVTSGGKDVGDSGVDPDILVDRVKEKSYEEIMKDVL